MRNKVNHHDIQKALRTISTLWRKWLMCGGWTFLPFPGLSLTFFLVIEDNHPICRGKTAYLPWLSLTCLSNISSINSWSSRKPVYQRNPRISAKTLSLTFDSLLFATEQPSTILLLPLKRRFPKMWSPKHPNTTSALINLWWRLGSPIRTPRHHGSAKRRLIFRTINTRLESTCHGGRSMRS